MRVNWGSIVHPRPPLTGAIPPRIRAPLSGRTAGDPAALASAVRRRVHEVEPARAVYELSTVPEQLSEAFGEVRIRTLLLTLFALTALALACVGLYGTMSHLVTTRRREVGLRLALGAGRVRVGPVVMQGLAVAGSGALAGLILAAGSARFLSGMLYGVAANDVAALCSATVAMLAVALVASEFRRFARRALIRWSR